MPQLRAAVVRFAPSRTSASASIRREARAFFSRPAARRSSAAVKSLRVISIADIAMSPVPNRRH